MAASVFTHTSESILITDADGGILDVNEAFTRITGYTREEVLGKNPRLLELGPPAKEEFYADLWAQLKAERDNGPVRSGIAAKAVRSFLRVLTISAVPDAAWCQAQAVCRPLL